MNRLLHLVAIPLLLAVLPAGRPLAQGVGDADGDGLPDVVEDANGNGLVDAGETDPQSPDTDGGGTPDGLEVEEGTDPTFPLDDGDADPDGDGLLSRDERRLGTELLSADTDHDRLSDGLEVGGRGDADVRSTTDPLLADTDGDGLLDGEEDLDTDGSLGHEESDPNRADTDLGGSSDAAERTAMTDPRNPEDDPDGDPDADGLTTREEGTRGTNPKRADTDQDGLDDGFEVRVGGTDPRLSDSDGDGLIDPVEDANRDGRLDADETDPRLEDTDRGGSRDGEERRLGTDPRDPLDDPGGDFDDDGLTLAAEEALGTDPFDNDTDDDGLPDGLEAGSTTSPLNADSDADDLSDGAEDANRNGRLDGGETNPNRADTDAGGTPDGRERADGTDPIQASDDLERDGDHDGLTGRRERELGTRLDDADSDDDGVPDGAEVLAAEDTDGDGRINALDFDSDDDSLPDGLESGAAGPGPGTDQARGRFRADLDPASTTSPVRADTDGGGLADGDEDANHNGRQDEGETSPTRAADDGEGPPDADADGLTDAEELTAETDPEDADSDDDGIVDGQETLPLLDSDGDGAVNAADADSDDDGVDDGVERGVTRAGRGTDPAGFTADADGATQTDPVSADSDRDGRTDGAEDSDANGRFDAGETDPARADTDGDGLSDDLESLRDLDGDGLIDAADADSDNDGVNDGDEDSNHNGRVDPGETDPRQADGPGPDGGASPDGGSSPDASEPAPVDLGFEAELGPLVRKPGDRAALTGEGVDTDADGIDDVAERALGLNPLDDDSDDDGLADGEDGDLDVDGDGRINALDPDSDGDGIADGVEAGRINGVRGTSLAAGVFRADSDPRSRTSPVNADTDGGGADDGAEDLNRNGRLDVGETDPTDPADDQDAPGPSNRDSTAFDTTTLRPRSGAGRCSAMPGGVSALGGPAVFGLLASLLLGCGTRRRRARALGLTVLAAAVAVPESAGAYDANGLRPALGTQSLSVVETASVGRHRSTRFSVLYHFARAPLVADYPDGEQAGPLVENLSVVELGAAIALVDRLEIGLGMPVAVNLSGRDGEVLSGQADQNLNGGALGDLRGVLNIGLLPRRGPGVGLALGLEATAPTGRETSYLGTPGWTWEPRLLLDAALGGGERIVLAANVGYRLRSEEKLLGEVVDDSLRWAAGVSVRLPASFRVAAEMFGDAPVGQGRAPAGSADALGTVSYGFLPCFHLTAGGGAGLISSPGSAAWRGLGGLTWRCDEADLPAPDEGIASASPAPANDGRPTPHGADADADGVDDAHDACRDRPEDFDGFEETDGCPEPDNDGDQIPDTGDLCPNAAEDRDGFQDQDGCPDQDDDHDQVADVTDLCPRMPEDPDGIEDTDGCPETDPPMVAAPMTRFGNAEVRGKLIVLAKVIEFPSHGTRLSPSVRDALADVATLLTSRPDLQRVRVEVHTDSQGADLMNLTLSQARADSIRRLLIELGISSDRLVAVGKGESEPIDSNADSEGRAANRRLELHLD